MGKDICSASYCGRLLTHVVICSHNQRMVDIWQYRYAGVCQSTSQGVSECQLGQNERGDESLLLRFRKLVALWFLLDPVDMAVYLPCEAAFDPDIFKLSGLFLRVKGRSALLF